MFGTGPGLAVSADNPSPVELLVTSADMPFWYTELFQIVTDRLAAEGSDQNPSIPKIHTKNGEPTWRSRRTE